MRQPTDTSLPHRYCCVRFLGWLLAEHARRVTTGTLDAALGSTVVILGISAGLLGVLLTVVAALWPPLDVDYILLVLGFFAFMELGLWLVENRRR